MFQLVQRFAHLAYILSAPGCPECEKALQINAAMQRKKGAVRDEIIGPHMAGTLRPQPHA